MSFYAKTEPGERDNELHSILGTEVADLSPALEQHYRAYFSDRQKVVALFDNYSAVFTKLQTESQQLVTRMNDLSASIEARVQRYNKDVAQLTSDINDFNNRAKNGGFSSQAQFDSERAVLESRAADLDDERQSINDDIATYKQLQRQLAQISSQSEALNRSINSSLSPAPSI
jgi:chromosome segregation ATPase